jgi:hypothetical protein
MPTKFREAALSRYGAMLQLGENGAISFSGVFLIRFLYSFLLNVL